MRATCVHDFTHFHPYFLNPPHLGRDAIDARKSARERAGSFARADCDAAGS